VEDVVTRAFCLRTRAFGESDLIAVLLTEDHGKVSGVARGAKRSRKRFGGGALEPFHELSLRFARRPHTDLAFLHESRVELSHHAIAQNLDTYAWASYVSELTEVMVPERDPAPEVFALFATTMAGFARAAEPAEPLAHRFIMGLLDSAGWGPDLGQCGICGAAINERSKPILDERGSGVICSRHVAERQGADPDDANFRPGRRIIDQDLLSYVESAREAVPVASDLALVATATALLDRLIDLHLQRPLKSRAFLGQLRAQAAEDAAANQE
jgi:DNA repair protein RecO (recombination protein O)